VDTGGGDILVGMSGKKWLGLLACCVVAGSAAAQTTQDELSARLKGQQLFLRGCWAIDNITFGADGQPLKPLKVVSFTESGIDVKTVKLKSDRLEIEGQRMVLEFDSKDNMKRVPLKASNYSGGIKLNIMGGPGTDFGQALDAIFAPDLASMTPTLPLYWQTYAKQHFLTETSNPPEVITPTKSATSPVRTEDSANVKAMHIGGSVKPPKVLKSEEPMYTYVARAMTFSGNVQLYLWVDENGLPSHIHIAKPVGLGLDEAAIAAVQRYKFSPAMQNGKPVKVDLYIDVNFQIF
jgi:TonB family protein